MITFIAPAPRRWPRRAGIGLAGAGLAAVLASIFLESPAPEDAKVATHLPRHVVPVAQEGVRSTAFVVPDNAAIADAVPRRPAQAPDPLPRPSRPFELPFRFIGKVDSGSDGTSLVLFGRGRTVKVQAPGPLDDEYVVDAIEEGYLMLRHLPSGTTHVLELASRLRSLSPGDSAGEALQD